jgi:hypothetical protein
MRDIRVPERSDAKTLGCQKEGRGAHMITVNVFDVRPAGDIGSRRAAHAAISAAAHKHIAADKTQRPWIGALPT